MSQSIWSKRLKDISLSRKHGITGRTVVAPIVALVGARLLFVYARSSVYHAKRNAERYRTADGGQFSWYKETKRRHHVLASPEESITVRSLLGRRPVDDHQPVGRESPKSRNEETIEARRKPVDGHRPVDREPNEETIEARRVSR